MFTFTSKLITKLSYVQHVPGHKDSLGKSTPWVIRAHQTGGIISSHKSKIQAEKHLRDMYTHKSAIDWAGPVDKYNQRQDRDTVKKVWNGIVSKVEQLKQTIKVRGRSLDQYLNGHPVRSLFFSNDLDARKAGYDLRRIILDYVQSEFDQTTLNKFKQTNGTNVTDWLTKTSTYKARLLNKK
jgi:hypothetical protein